MSFADLFVADESELVEHYPNTAEKAADGVVHAVGMLATLIGGGALVAFALMRGGLSLGAASAVYAMCLMAMLAASAVYNLTRPSPARRILRRIDEAAIFLMIAGSYTPFTIKLLPPVLAIGITTFVWIAALSGAAGKVLLPRITDRTWCLVYLAFGWMAVVFIGPLLPALSPLAIGLLVAAGLTYSAGVILYLKHDLPYRRALWHVCVIVGAAGHYGAVLVGLVLPGAS